LKSQYFQELFKLKKLNIFKSLPDSWKMGKLQNFLYDRKIKISYFKEVYFVKNFLPPS